jgi:hypothetical protein
MSDPKPDEKTQEESLTNLETQELFLCFFLIFLHDKFYWLRK